jgi:hypothetical protein
MADDLEENYVIEENFLNKKKQNDDEIDIEFDTQQQPGEVVETNRKKQKKKTITEILELNKDEINKPEYARNELIKILNDYIDKKLSIVEKNDLNLTEDTIGYLNKLILKRKSTKLSLEKQFEKKYEQKLQKYLKLPKLKNGQPFAIVLCSSAQRCIEVQRQLDKFTGKRIRWMYAFAKHKKLVEQIDFLKKNRVNLIFATPNRLNQLLADNDDVFRGKFLKQIKYLVIDYTNRDCKLKRFIDINEIRSEFIKLFFDFIQTANCKAKNGKVKIKIHLV